MPWSDAQVRLFAAAAHDPKIAAAHGIKPAKARSMLMESSPEERSSALKKQKERSRQLRTKS